MSKIPSGKCCDCGTQLFIEVLSSAAGYYIGTFCRNFSGGCGGPHDRQSDYFRTREAAEGVLVAMEADLETSVPEPSNKRVCVYCGRIVDNGLYSQLMEDCSYIFERADVHGVESLTEAEQVAYLGLLCSKECLDSLIERDFS